MNDHIMPTSTCTTALTPRNGTPLGDYRFTQKLDLCDFQPQDWFSGPIIYNMFKAEDTGNNPGMPKRTTLTVHISEVRSVNHTKRSRSLPTPPQTICSAVSEAPLKNLYTQKLSPVRVRIDGGKTSLRGRSYNQIRALKKGSHSRGKAVLPEVEKLGKANGDTPEVSKDTANVQTASSSSMAAHQESRVRPLQAQCGKLCIRSDDEAKLSCKHRDKIFSSGERACKGFRHHYQRSSPLPEIVKDDPEGIEPLLPELMDDILSRLPLLQVMQVRSKLGKCLSNAILRPSFHRNRPSWEGEYSPTSFVTDDHGDLHWYGWDTLLRKWTRLPSLNFAKEFLPSPDSDLFKDYLVAGDGGLLCINVGKSIGREKLVICNPLTQQVKVLPPLIHSRHPVLMHLKVDHDSGHYKVIVAGSATIGTDELSLKTEEYDSRTGVWICPDGADLPCPAFGLNEYQNGVYVKDSQRELLMCVAIVDTRGRGVLVYDITKKKWAQGPHVKQLHIPLVRSEPNVSHLATTQIVGCGGSVYVFSEQECGRDVYFVIHKLNPDVNGDFTWDEVTNRKTWEEIMKRKRTGGRGLLVYPEFTCVPVSEHELCIFNTVEHSLEIIDLSAPTEVTPLQLAPTFKGNRFHSLNPIGFVFRPSFRSVVCPRGCNPKRRDEHCSEHCSERCSEHCSEGGSEHGSEHCSESRASSESFLRNGLPMNVCRKLTHGPGSLEELSRQNVATAPTQKTHMSADLGASNKPHDILTNKCGLADEEERKRRNSSEGGGRKIVY